MIRVLHILDTMASGGVERRRLSIAKFLDPSKFELKIICTNAVGPFPDEIRQLGVEVIAIGDLKSFLDFKQHQKVIKVINEFKPHIIHGAVFEGVTMAAISGFLKRVPIIILEETSDPQTRSWKGNLLMKSFSYMADQIIGVSPAATNYLLHQLKLPNNKVKLINNGVAIPAKVSEEVANNLKIRLKIKEDEVVIGSVGRMSSDATKRFSDLIKAFALLYKKNPKTKLVLVGEGREVDNYKKLVDDLAIKDNVLFMGYQHEIGQFYAIFDVFCLVSAHESFGLVLAEAMLHQLPVVATRVGGMQYIVDDAITGYLVEKYDVDAMFQKLEVLVTDQKIRCDLGKKGLEKALSQYTEERYVRDVQLLYTELLLKKKVLY